MTILSKWKINENIFKIHQVKWYVKLSSFISHLNILEAIAYIWVCLYVSLYTHILKEVLSWGNNSSPIAIDYLKGKQQKA